MNESMIMESNTKEILEVIIDDEKIPQVTLDNLFNNKGDDE